MSMPASDEVWDESLYIDDVREGRISRESALRQLEDEYRPAMASLARIHGVFDALGEEEVARPLKAAIKQIEDTIFERCSIDEDGVISFV